MNMEAKSRGKYVKMDAQGIHYDGPLIVKSFTPMLD